MQFRRAWMAVTVGAVLWCGSAPATAGEYAATDDFFKACGQKIKRGAVNTFTGWLELFNQPAKMVKKEEGAGGKTKGLVLGILKGFWYGIGRTGHGIVELGGFWAANHKSNEDVGVPLDAEYAWEEGTPAAEYGKPIGNKLARGVIDTFTGWLELVGQPVSKTKEWGAGRGCTLGLLRGLWFGISRTGHGIVDFGGFLFPNPVDTAGYPYDTLRSYDAFQKEGAAK